MGRIWNRNKSILGFWACLFEPKGKRHNEIERDKDVNFFVINKGDIDKEKYIYPKCLQDSKMYSKYVFHSKSLGKKEHYSEKDGDYILLV